MTWKISNLKIVADVIRFMRAESMAKEGLFGKEVPVVKSTAPKESPITTRNREQAEALSRAMKYDGGDSGGAETRG